MWIIQGPEEVREHRIDWTEILNGDSVATSEWIITPNDGNSPQRPSLSNETQDTGGIETAVTVSDLDLGVSYQLRNIVTLESGQVREREITIRCARS